MNEPRPLPNQIVIPPRIEKAMRELEGVGLNKLRDMVRRSVRFSHAQGNCRFLDYLFTVDHNTLTSVKRLRYEADEIVTVGAPEPKVRQGGGAAKCEHCDNGRVKVFDPCSHCETGCKFCEGGLIPRFIACSICGGKGVKHKHS